MVKPRANKADGASVSDKRRAKAVSGESDEDVIMRDITDVEESGKFNKDTPHQEDKEAENSSKSAEESSQDEEDEEQSGILRLSEQYRRYSESQKELDRTNNNNSHGGENTDSEKNDDDNDDMMRSIHQSQAEGNDNEDDNEDDDEGEEDEGDLDLEDELLQDAFQSFTTRLQQNAAAAAGSSASGTSGQRGSGTGVSGGLNSNNPASTLAETMTRIFPEAMGLFGHLGGAGGGQIRGLIEGLRNRDDSFLVLETLNELSERLLMMNAPMAEREIPSHELANALTGVLTEPMFMEELELQLVACRCLYNFLEVNPDYIHSAVQAGAIEALQSKLLEISYIDLAEQALQALEFISRFAGTQIFKRNCLLSCLQYLDFFTIHAQRKAITIAANSVKYIRESEFEIVEEIFPILQRIAIEFSDPQELDNTWLAITRIIKNFRSSSLLTKLVNSELLNKIISSISHTDTNLTTNLRLIKTLSICARNDELSVKILQGDKVADSIAASLAKYSKSNTTTQDSVSIEALMSAPKDLIISVLDLIINLLPSEKNSILTIQFTKKDYSSVKQQYYAFVNTIFQILINIYSSTVIFDIRRRVMVSLIRIISSLDNIKVLENPSQIINLLASIVIQNKSIIRQEKTDEKPYVALLGSLILTHLLAEKDSDKFISLFEREGLIADTSSLLEILRSDERVQINDIEKSTTNAHEDENEDESGNYGNNDTHDDDERLYNEMNHGEGGEENEEEEEEEEEEEDDDDDDEDDDDDDEDDDEMEDEERSVLFNISDQAIFRPLTIPQLFKHLIKYASDIEQKYLSMKASGSSKLEHLRLLDEISAVLKDDFQTKDYKYEDWTQVWKNFSKALGDQTNSISSFELISSGFIEVLSTLFSSESTGSPGTLCRSSFLEIFSNDSFELLIKKLQEALNRSESFEIISCGLKTGENRAASLGKQVKVRLVSLDPNEETPQFRGMENFVVLIHAISSFNNVNAFFKRKMETHNFFKNLTRSARNSRMEEAVDIDEPEDESWHMEFLLNGEVIPYDSTIYGALYKHLQDKNENFDRSDFWYQIHEVQYRKVLGDPPNVELDGRYPGTSFDEIDEGSIELLQHPITMSILNLLKILHEFNENSSSFTNFKLTAKLNRQIEEPLIVASGILPPWAIHITRKYPFLFPMSTRIFFLQSTSFGYARLIQLWSARANHDQPNQNDNNNNNALPLGRPTRHKLRVSRNHLLQSAFKVLDKVGAHPSVLEIEFLDEVGTGLGPTLEFYANVSKCFSEKKLNLWREDEHHKNDTTEYVYNPLGLFPIPISDKSSTIKHENFKNFKYLGKFAARALLDNRIVDFGFNNIFFDIAQSIISEQPISPKVGLEKLKYVDSSLYSSLTYLKSHKDIVGTLGINFTLPGYSHIELIEDGENVDVDSGNVDEFIDSVVEVTIGANVRKQIEKFIEGFSEVFPFSSMLIFTPSELSALLGNATEDWSYEILISSVHADHGYTIDSPSVQRLIGLMAKFNKIERRLFLQFLTGSPRLPIGGFKKLKPVFTVVLKHTEGGLKPDDYLPSVMTCANYLKLPNYSSEEVMKERMMKAVREGAGAFLLS